MTDVSKLDAAGRKAHFAGKKFSDLSPSDKKWLYSGKSNWSANEVQTQLNANGIEDDRSENDKQKGII